jgi:hypothetical protein
VKNKKKIKEDINALNVDSLWDRESAIKKDKGGESAQEMLGIEPDMPGNIDKIQPMKMMDIVMNSWEGDSIRGGHESYEEDDGEESHTGQDLSSDFEFAKNHDDDGEKEIEDYEDEDNEDNDEDEDDWTDDEKGEELGSEKENNYDSEEDEDNEENDEDWLDDDEE